MADRHNTIANPILDGQVSLVTGAGRGIGRAIALALAKAGAAVALLARTEEQIAATAADITSEGGTALVVPGDVTCWSDMIAAVERTEQVCGPIDVLVNNAGGAYAIGPLWELDPEIWWDDVRLNLKGSVLGTRAVLPGMIDRRKGRIINVASLLGTRPDAFQSAYVAAKGGLILFTESTAIATRDFGVSLFAMSPGLVRTSAFERVTNSEAGRRWLPALSDAPEERFTSVEQSAELALRLASGDVDALSGRFLHVGDDLARILIDPAVIDRDLHVLRLRR